MVFLWTNEMCPVLIGHLFQPFYASPSNLEPWASVSRLSTQRYLHSLGVVPANLEKRLLFEYFVLERCVYNPEPEYTLLPEFHIETELVQRGTYLVKANRETLDPLTPWMDLNGLTPIARNVCQTLFRRIYLGSLSPQELGKFRRELGPRASKVKATPMFLAQFILGDFLGLLKGEEPTRWFDLLRGVEEYPLGSLKGKPTHLQPT